MMTHLNVPAVGVVVFLFTDIWTPEGFLRIKMWRPQVDTDRALFGFDASTVAAELRPNIIVELRDRLITSLPEALLEAENYFTEVTTSEFSFGIYNTRSPADILRIRLEGLNDVGRTEFADTSDGRLLFRHIKPTESTSVFGQFSFLSETDTTFVEVSTGELQQALAGSDLRWLHGKDRSRQDDPYLDERDNAPLDAEQIFDLKFINAVSSALEKTPARPSTEEDGSVPADPDKNIPGYQSWVMPFAKDEAVTSGPWVTIDGRTIVQGTADVTSTSGGITTNGRWQHHIHPYLWLSAVFDFAFGAGKWTFECDTAPIKLIGSDLVPVSLPMGGGVIITQLPNPAPKTITTELTPTITDWILIPQFIWDLYRDVITAIDVPHVEDLWYKYHQSAWDSIIEYCLSFGWTPLVEKRDGLAHIHFKDRTKALDFFFSGPVPIDAKPEAFPESENGIQIEGAKTSLHDEEADGWYDDLYAAKRGRTTPYTIAEQADGTGPTCNLTLPQANPYTVPFGAKKPATLKTLLRLGGWAYGKDLPQLFQSWFYGLLNPDGLVGFETQSNKNYFFPMVTPLVFGNGLIPVHSTQNDDVDAEGWEMHDFKPVSRAQFTITKTDGTEATITSDSLRQTLARFYAMLFVKSARRYSCEEGTINKFFEIFYNADDDTDILNGTKTGLPTWRNIKLFAKRRFPDGHRYYCKRILRSWNEMKTSTEYLRVEFENPFLDGNFYDSEEQAGKTWGDPPNGDDPRTRD